MEVLRCDSTADESEGLNTFSDHIFGVLVFGDGFGFSGCEMQGAGARAGAGAKQWNIIKMDCKK